MDLIALIDRVIRDSESNFREKRIEIVHEVKEPMTAWVDLDATEQVVKNLLDNACQYTEAGGRVEVSVTGDPEWASVRVADSGIGISERDVGRIFERFYRVRRQGALARSGWHRPRPLDREAPGPEHGRRDLRRERAWTRFDVHAEAAAGARIAARLRRAGST